MSKPVFLEETTAMLERTPRVVRELVADLPAGWLGEPDTPGGWTARDVVGHLISAELGNWIPRTEVIIRDGTCPLAWQQPLQLGPGTSGVCTLEWPLPS